MVKTSSESTARSATRPSSKVPFVSSSRVYQAPSYLRVIVYRAVGTLRACTQSSMAKEAG
jgi:hypothetical protein